ncbi:MAG: hypothetical protein COY69_01030 [Candidatus Magasanikbacteria bacterium CG_4_10_14_0_8_um_filter_32_14]|uniref:Uncharacterized protein n=2 Tax=Candidatus Magasanikiibacteriota TaxID=1752731 RepID=A0A2M7RA89_9BACT|nr:MAG: hypothetical protein AUJ23_02585 [Candidatus Magasanikbacteria bacterium CG1_02_32_51]PIY93564.1 MAG: hypothetical protein COY69_01030 [Candidatus Magasanikbacteria bacterium CG_4_10_14_0_8_um_filter_32_14]
MEYLKIKRLNTDSSGIKLFTRIFYGMVVVNLLLGVLIKHFLEVLLLVLAPAFLLFWIIMKLVKGDDVTFTDSEIYQTNIFKKKTKSIKHTEIVEIFALSSSINYLATAVGSIGSVARPSISISIIPFSKIISSKESFGGTNTIVISKKNRDDLMQTRFPYIKRLADNKDCIVLNPRKEVIDLLYKILPQYIKEN